MDQVAAQAAAREGRFPMVADSSPFDFSGDERGVLCIHGFTGTPFEMRFLGRRLHQRGMTVVGPALPGHCTSAEELDQTRWQDWYQAVETNFDALRDRCTSVAVVGQSLGGLLALRLAAERGPDLVAAGSLAAPLWLSPLATRTIALTQRVPLLARLVPNLPKLGGFDIAHRPARAIIPSYSVIPTRALHQLAELMALVRSNLEAITVPLAVIHAEQDHTAPFASAAEITSRVGSDDVQLRALSGSFHLIADDLEREIVAAEIGGFFEARFARRRAA